MNIVATVNGVLAQLRPFILMVALICGTMAAWGVFTEWLPVLKQVWAGRGNPQTNAVIGAALALIAGRA